MNSKFRNRRTLTPDDARVVGPTKDRERDDRRPDAWSEADGEQQCNENAGEAMLPSANRISNESVRPPIYPAAKPISGPTALDITTTTAETPRETRAPQMRRLRMSRPRLSVPRMYAGFPPSRKAGGVSFCGRAIRVGSQARRNARRWRNRQTVR